jgi:hemerythrin-like domain-containing protein
VRDPIDQLLEEHRDIMTEVEVLRRAVARLRDDGDAALPTTLPALRSVGRMMATRLLRHARKEDEVLFPALERAFGTIDGPTAVMRQEHRAIHDRARLFRATLRELNEVEHPAIVAGGGMLRALTDGGGDAAALVETGEEIVSLLDLHFGKEEDILFPMARGVLSDREMEEVGRRMEAIEAAGTP